MNNMILAEDLEITHALHRSLEFQTKAAAGGGWRDDPCVPDDDLVAACNFLLSDTNHATKAFCDKAKSPCAKRPCEETALVPSESEVKMLAPALHRIYGITGDILSSAKRPHLCWTWVWRWCCPSWFVG